jgi:hypothetical protein
MPWSLRSMGSKVEGDMLYMGYGLHEFSMLHFADKTVVAGASRIFIWSSSREFKFEIQY